VGVGQDHVHYDNEALNVKIMTAMHCNHCKSNYFITAAFLIVNHAITNSEL